MSKLFWACKIINFNFRSKLIERPTGTTKNDKDSLTYENAKVCSFHQFYEPPATRHVNVPIHYTQPDAVLLTTTTNTATAASSKNKLPVTENRNTRMFLIRYAQHANTLVASLPLSPTSHIWFHPPAAQLDWMQCTQRHRSGYRMFNAAQ